jgi:hypothetical protein
VLCVLLCIQWKCLIETKIFDQHMYFCGILYLKYTEKERERKRKSVRVSGREREREREKEKMKIGR